MQNNYLVSIDNNKIINYDDVWIHDNKLYFKYKKGLICGNFTHSLINFIPFTSDLFIINPIEFDYIYIDRIVVYYGILEYKIKSLTDKYDYPHKIIELDKVKNENYFGDNILLDIQNYYESDFILFANKILYLKHLLFRDIEFVKQFITDNYDDLDVLIFMLTMPELVEFSKNIINKLNLDTIITLNKIGLGNKIR